MLYALVRCLMAEEAEYNRRKRQRRFAVMAQFEELLGEHRPEAGHGAFVRRPQRCRANAADVLPRVFGRKPDAIYAIATIEQGPHHTSTYRPLKSQRCGGSPKSPIPCTRRLLDDVSVHLRGVTFGDAASRPTDVIAGRRGAALAGIPLRKAGMAFRSQPRCP
jgi:hypothetical protein